MKKNLSMAALVMLLLALGAIPAWSQNAAQIDGNVTNAGKPIPNAQVVLTNIETNRVTRLKADKNGKFAALGVAYGNYQIEVTSATGEKLFSYQKTIAPASTGGPVVLDIDISKIDTAPQGAAGAPGQPKYTKEQIEDIKKQNEKATNVNALITQAQTAMNAKNWQEALPILQQLVAADPTNWQFFQALGNAQFNLGQFDQAVEAYDKGVQTVEATTTVDAKNPNTDPAKKKAGEAQMLTNQGNAYLKLHKNNEAVAAFTKAASLDPNPAIAYFNLCATQYNTGNVDGALAACDKAIAADPNKADAYFIKGSMLIAGSKQDKEGKVEAPPGTAETLNKYLQLAPDGPHANDVKQMLAYIGSKVETTYKKRGK